MKNYNFRLIYKKQSKKEKIVKSLLFSLVFGLVVMLVCSYFLGYRAFAVLGSSSEPDIHYGSMAIDYKVPMEELKVGDYITWSRGGNSNVTHKIISINYEKDIIITSQTDYFVEVGETVVPDAPIKYANVRGKVLFSIPKLGTILLGLKYLVLLNNSINVLGLMTIILTIVSYYLFKKLMYVETYTLKG